MDRLKNVLERAAEEIENIYDRETELSIELRNVLALAEQGRLVELPCKVGDIIFSASEEKEIYEYTVVGFEMYSRGLRVALIYESGGLQCKTYVLAEYIGKTVFLTREEAEEKRAEMKGEENVD